MGVLNRIYGFNDVKVADNGSWTIEQVVSDGMVYTANILRDGKANVVVETLERFPKLVASYDVDSEN